jgi:hypothetical protein
MMQKRWTTAVLTLLLLAAAGGREAFAGDGPADVAVVSVQKIWDKSPHNAFTDLIRFQGRWYCVFREGLKHHGGIAGQGKLRVLTSPDGETWESAALMSSEEGDLRDPKLEITPDGRLMMVGFITLYEPKAFKHKSLAWFSKDGKSWTEAADVGHQPLWIWRVTRHGNALYTTGYACGERAVFRLYRSESGIAFEPVSDDLGIRPGECTLAFSKDGTCHALLRAGTGRLGTAKPPYTQWNWRDTGIRIGGPELLELPDGRFVAAGRSYGQGGGEGLAGWATVLSWVDFQKAAMTEFLRLPSAGDCSYPGMVYHDGLLWITYYSAHEEAVTEDYGKTSIYLAKVRLPVEPESR